jgi:hypothetical protein
VPVLDGVHEQLLDEEHDPQGAVARDPGARACAIDEISQPKERVAAGRELSFH